MQAVTTIPNNKNTTTFQTSEKTVAANTQNSPATLTTNESRTSSSNFLDTVVKILYPKRSPQINLHATINSNNQAQINTSDGYSITILGVDQGFTITRPDGDSTTIWGDPHVKESDGDSWDFFDRSSFLFGNNKITVETTPKQSDGTSFSQTITIYNGDDRLTITDIHLDKPHLESWQLDASSHDESLDDGNVFQLKIIDGKESWKKL